MQRHRIDWRPIDAQHQNPAKHGGGTSKKGKPPNIFWPWAGDRRWDLSLCPLWATLVKNQIPTNLGLAEPDGREPGTDPCCHGSRDNMEHSDEFENFAENEARHGRVVGGRLSLDRQLQTTPYL
jgi:hypothetical protein